MWVRFPPNALYLGDYESREKKRIQSETAEYRDRQRYLRADKDKSWDTKYTNEDLDIKSDN